jgi:hypothetical protein
MVHKLESVKKYFNMSLINLLKKYRKSGYNEKPNNGDFQKNIEIYLKINGLAVHVCNRT